MKVFVAGATGVLGRGLLRQFRDRGHYVIGLVRNETGERVVRSLGAESRRADLFNVESLVRASDGSEVVIHAATAIPVKVRPASKDWQMNDRIRREGTKALSDAARRIGARAFLLQSIVWVARPPGDSSFNETAYEYPDATTQSALDAERIARDAAGIAGMQVAVLRCGYFYGPEAGHTLMVGEGICKHRFPVIGDGTAIWPNLHTDDAAAAFVTVAEKGGTGLWHVVDDHPSTAEEFLMEFAIQLDAAAPARIPVWLGHLIAGPTATAFFTRSTRTSNARIKADFGWTPRYPSYKEGIPQIVATWHAKGITERWKGKKAA
jgi:nucleoside-diphosphate-sugar epimerase